MSWTINSKTIKTLPAATDSIPIQEAAGTVKRALISWFAPSSWFDSFGNSKKALHLETINLMGTAEEPVEAIAIMNTLGNGEYLIYRMTWDPLQAETGSNDHYYYATVTGANVEFGYCRITLRLGNSSRTWFGGYDGNVWTNWKPRIDSDGNPIFPTVATTASAANAYIAGSGSTILQSTSSAKYKTDIRDLEDTSTLDALRPVLYKSNPETVPGDDPTLDHYGFIAEELHEIDEKLVQYKEDEIGEKTPNGVQYDRVVVLLVKRIHELEARLAKAGI